MTTTRMMIAVLIAGSGLALHVTHAGQPGIKPQPSQGQRDENSTIEDAPWHTKSDAL